jgi:hypothetical protein
MANKIARSADAERVAENIAAMGKQLRAAERRGDRELAAAIRDDIARMRAWGEAGCPGLHDPPRQAPRRRPIPEVEPGKTVFYMLPGEETWPGAEMAARQGAAAWAMLRKGDALAEADRAKRAKGRRDQVGQREAERLEAFRTKVWPALAPRFGKRGWRNDLERLCGAAGIGASARTLDRLIAAARAAGVIPRLRVRHRS